MDINLTHRVELTVVQRDFVDQSKVIQIPNISNHKLRPRSNVFGVDGIDFS